MILKCSFYLWFYNFDLYWLNCLLSSPGLTLLICKFLDDSLPMLIPRGILIGRRERHLISGAYVVRCLGFYILSMYGKWSLDVYVYDFLLWMSACIMMQWLHFAFGIWFWAVQWCWAPYNDYKRCFNPVSLTCFNFRCYRMLDVDKLFLSGDSPLTIIRFLGRFCQNFHVPIYKISAESTLIGFSLGIREF
jgi:hypothetical protein